MLASVSMKLAKCCISPLNPGKCFLSANSEVLRLFFEWILRRPVDTDDQETMVRAWHFGRDWEIPAFQNDVMRCLVAELNENYVDLWAMRQAYQAITPKHGAYDKLLQRAFVTEFARDLRGESYPGEDLIESGLDECIDFHRDFTHLMCLAYDYDNDYNPRTDGARIEELLVSETIG
jgi:hypothetical protein